MPEELLIQPLSLADFAADPLAITPGFGDIVASELGDAATPADGFEEVFAAVSGIMDSLDAGAVVLGALLDGVFSEAGTIDAAPVAATAAGFAASLPAADAAVADLGQVIADATDAVTSTPPPPTPSGGGGGVVSDVELGGGSGCDPTKLASVYLDGVYIGTVCNVS